MRWQDSSDHDVRDALQVTATFSLIILASLLHLAGTMLLIGVVVTGLLMIFDHNYLPLFDQWLVAVILYIVYRVAILSRRPKTGLAIMLMVMPGDPEFDAEFDTDFDTGRAAGFGTAPPLRRLPPHTVGQPYLTLISHDR